MFLRSPKTPCVVELCLKKFLILLENHENEIIIEVSLKYLFLCNDRYAIEQAKKQFLQYCYGSDLIILCASKLFVYYHPLLTISYIAERVFFHGELKCSVQIFFFVSLLWYSPFWLKVVCVPYSSNGCLSYLFVSGNSLISSFGSLLVHLTIMKSALASNLPLYYTWFVIFYMDLGCSDGLPPGTCKCRSDDSFTWEEIIRRMLEDVAGWFDTFKKVYTLRKSTVDYPVRRSNVKYGRGDELEPGHLEMTLSAVNQ